MFENIGTFFKKIMKTEPKQLTSKDAAKERLHLVLMQDRANVSVDFLELMKQEILDVIKKYIEIDEKSIDVRLTNQANEDGTNGAPALYANIPIINIKNETKAEKIKENIEDEENIENKEEVENSETQQVQDIKEVKEEVKNEDKKQEEEIETQITEEVVVEENKEEVKKENEEEIDDVPTFDELLKKSEEEENAESEEQKSNDFEKPKAKKKSTNKGKTKEEK